jgi:hypothetical protein
MTQVLDFTGILDGQPQAAVPMQHQGFVWEGFTAYDAADPLYAQSGYAAVAAASASGTVASVSGASPRLRAGAADDFDLVSMIVGSAWNTNLRIKIIAYDNHVQVGKVVVKVSQGDALKVLFDEHFTSIDKIVFRAGGGRDADPFDGGAGTQPAFADITVDRPAALATDWAL